MLYPIPCLRSQWMDLPAESLLLQADVRDAAAQLLPAFAGSAQTVYLDPPFYTGKRFEMRAGAAGKTVTSTAYEDRFESREAYLALMREALVLARALLREDGTIFLHCDGRMNAHLRLLMDEIFGEENFLNEIVWSYQSGGRSLRHFPRKHDSILFCARSPGYQFSLKAVPIGTAADRSNHMRKQTDEDGRSYRTIRSCGKEYRYYDDAPVYPSDVWTDIPHLQQRDPERMGFETQKPLALLRRILLCATREGDLVCDLFHGSGTTAAAAMALGRRFLCLDKSALSLSLSESRLLPPNGGRPASGFAAEAVPAADGAAEAYCLPAAGSCAVGLSSFACDRAREAGIPGMDTVDSLAAGFLREGVFHIAASARRAKNKALPRELIIPASTGEPCLRITDIWGERRFFLPERRI